MEAVLAGLGAHIHDLARAVGDHDAQHRLVHEVGALGVDIHLLVVVCLGGFHEVHSAEHTCHMVQDVDAAEGLDGQLHHSVHLALDGDVALSGHRLDAVLLDGLPSGGLGGLSVHVGDNQIRACGGQHQRRAAAHTAATSGDNGVFALQRDSDTFHIFLHN